MMSFSVLVHCSARDQVTNVWDHKYHMLNLKGPNLFIPQICDKKIRNQKRSVSEIPSKDGDAEKEESEVRNFLLDR